MVFPSAYFNSRFIGRFLIFHSLAILLFCVVLPAFTRNPHVFTGI